MIENDDAIMTYAEKKSDPNTEGVPMPAGPEWMRHAACTGADPAVFFATETTGRQNIAKAVALCSSCPVLAICRRHADETPERFGVWGGTTAFERGWDRYGLSMRQSRRGGARPARRRKTRRLM
ncbi:WhiB family transcriptional regulator [Streptomyces olivoreticuli]|uniref:WhiB family transcriptional regulator n=1 Tax=Streptomyces olivoreticuli TaxID=68246 RepID=UPI001F07940D|nr:WhiB family transcriptional regulator [Streptomyces olivoreticuli]